MNLTLLAKPSWTILTQPDSLWITVMRQKYLHTHSIMEVQDHTYARQSSTWHAIVAGSQLMHPGVLWRIGDGMKVKFWRDGWTIFGPLEPYALCPLSDSHKQVRVSYYILNSG